MNFTQYIFEESRILNDKIAIFHKDKVISYSELYSLILKIIGKIESLKIKPKENIILMADNSFFFVASYLAIIGSGRIVVPIHPDFGKQNFQFVRQSCDVNIFFIQKKYWKRFISYEIYKEIVFSNSDIDNAINIFTLENSNTSIKTIENRNDLAVIIFTSGSTGTPKGVMLSHYNLRYNTDSIIKYLQLKNSDRVMVILPFSYCFGASLLHTHLRVGGQIVLNNMFMFPGKVLDEINDKECTNFAGVPSVFSILLRRSPLKKMKFPTLRLVQQAGGKLTNNYIEELREALPTTKIYVMYGQTEATARLSYLPPQEVLRKIGSIGKGIPDVVLKIVDKTGAELSFGEVGEIIAKGDNIMKGYFKDLEMTSSTVKNGWLHTGDLAKMDEEGYLYLMAREKEIIKVGGKRVSPKEIEEVILSIPEVVDCTIKGVEDEILGEALKAVVVVDGSCDVDVIKTQIIKLSKEKLALFKSPQVFEFSNSMNLKATGKK